ncbi:hypothetical protein NLJ89_g10191 [Agrocybe chaxingu]|uniref:C2H2-type domain-containing protein n=1 Tax=Agrocybe chaxingu TaxID=84603 RepID=A0A9W8JZ58_9AGAR|nr:hypothetical protein NLJ89_g10191 [Agrocybe chaxingu]
MTYCDRCDRYFNHWGAYDQHIANSSAHNVCDDCDIDFETWMGLREHWVQSPRHNYCQYCNEPFGYKHELIEHYEDNHYYCSSCNRVFTNEHGLKEHYRQSDRHYYCPSCDRFFDSANSLKNHLNSSIHRPKDVMCPFRGCDEGFVSRAALVLHLESGTCRSGIDRATVNKVVRQYDKTGIITDPSRLLTSGSNGNQNITYMATAASWNGYGFECYLCDKVCQTIPALNQHLASPRHQEKIYICRGSECSQRFNTLSGLVQHIESEKCGILKMRAVQNVMDNVLGRMGRITICYEGFQTYRDFEQHFSQSESLPACEHCSKHFCNRKILITHLTNKHHQCPLCNRFFNRAHGFQEHCEELDIHHYCGRCHQFFESENNLKNHLQSSKHVVKGTDCRGCDRSLVSRSALLLHYDVGACPSGINLTKVNKVVRQREDVSVIADISHLRTKSNSNSRYVPDFALGETVCPLRHQRFEETRDLMQHLQSPYHDEKVYVCRGTDCGASFALLSTLVQHVDSEKCDASEYEGVVGALEDVLSELEAYLDK